MRWRFVDRIDSFEPWTSIRGRKAVSLEEYLLLERFGRQGILPESLVLESCVHLARWLVVRSSDFAQSCVLNAVEGFSWQRSTEPGQRLQATVTVQARDESGIRVECAVEDGELFARGTLSLAFAGLGELEDPEASRALWRELYGAA